MAELKLGPESCGPIFYPSNPLFRPQPAVNYRKFHRKSGFHQPRGGGPACLPLRVELTEAELEAVNSAVLLTDRPMTARAAGRFGGHPHLYVILQESTVFGGTSYLRNFSKSEGGIKWLLAAAFPKLEPCPNALKC